MQEQAAALAETIEQVLPGWVERSVVRVVQAWKGDVDDGANEVVAEQTDGTAGERRRVARRRLVEARERFGSERVGIAAVAERPAQHGVGLDTDEGPAPHTLTLLGGLEQKSGVQRIERAQLEERRHGRLAVVNERDADGDQVVRACQRPRFIERGRDRKRPRARTGGSGARRDGHRARARCRRGCARGCAAGREGGR